MLAILWIDLSSISICPFLIIRTISIPLSVIDAESNDLKPSVPLVILLMARWSCSTGIVNLSANSWHNRSSAISIRSVVSHIYWTEMSQSHDQSQKTSVPQIYNYHSSLSSHPSSGGLLRSSDEVSVMEEV